MIALKTGRSEQGAKVAMSHTSSLAGADTLYDALFERYGIARMNSVTAFVETLKFLHHGGPLKDNRIVSMSCSGGEAALIADMALEKKVRFPALRRRHQGRRSQPPSMNMSSIDNPLDYHTFIWNQEDKLTATFSAVLRGGFDVGDADPRHPDQSGNAVPTPGSSPRRRYANAAKVDQGARADGRQPRFPNACRSSLPPIWRPSGVAPMMGLDDALTAFEAAAFIGRNWARATKPPALAAPAVSRRRRTSR